MASVSQGGSSGLFLRNYLFPMRREWTPQIIGDPGRIRTCGLQIRNLALYPTELRDRDESDDHFTSPCAQKSLICPSRLFIVRHSFTKIFVPLVTA